MFILTSEHLSTLCELNHFQVPEEGMIFFGLRGTSPIDVDDFSFRNEHQLVTNTIDYVHPLCTLIQWLPAKGEFAIFAGSTVPHKKYIKNSLERSGQGANQLMTGYYADYRKGQHNAGKATGHDAFRQTKAHPIRRTADDFDYDNDDRVEFTNPFDNIHAAWSMGPEHDYYGSAGCQVIVGYPKCQKLEFRDDTGPWGEFKRNAYADELDQNSFPYVLLSGNTAQRLVVKGPTNMIRLRYGSKGKLVGIVQSALKEKGFYEGENDEDFGQRTTKAVLNFQESYFGASADDGIVGPQTAQALGVQWPT